MAATFIAPFACTPHRNSNNSRSHKTRLRIAKERDGGVGTTVALNRLIFHPSEVTPEISTITLQPHDYRAAHITKVLRLPPQGGTIRAAVIDGLMYDDAQVTILPNNSVSVCLSSSFTYKPPPPPQVSLILALPRPKVLARLLPQIAAVGVSHLVLCNAYKVCQLIILITVTFCFFSLLHTDKTNISLKIYIFRLSDVTLTLLCCGTDKNLNSISLKVFHNAG